MIYREKVGDALIEYEGSPEEIDEYFARVSERTAKAIQEIVNLSLEGESEIPGEFPAIDKSKLN